MKYYSRYNFINFYTSHNQLLIDTHCSNQNKKRDFIQLINTPHIGGDLL